MSAEVLRQAAALMRSRAEAATPGPWSTYSTRTHRCIKSDMDRPVARVNRLVGMAAEAKAVNAEHMASWHPAVALAVADWLENSADVIDGMTEVGSPVHVVPPGCFAVARAYLGSDA